MDILIHPRPLRGEIQIIPSKSQAHRILICAAFANRPTRIICLETSRDMDATADCLRALGAGIFRTATGYSVVPVHKIPKKAELNCCESGSTLRFMLPVVGALGVDGTFLMEGRLPQRPLSPLWEEMERMGCTLSRPTENTLRCQGKLRCGEYFIDGSISSQFITGLLLALSLLDEESRLTITGKVESRPYIDLTRQVISLFEANADHPGAKPFHTPGNITVEGDWSNGAFFLAADHLNADPGLTIHGLNEASVQGDRAAAHWIPQLCLENCTIDASDIPDLVPILSITAAAKHGAVFTNIQRLRIKESDRVASTIAMIEGLGGRAWATEDTLTICGTGLTGGTVDACNDHRIAMSAAIASTVCSKDVIILGAECVKKSYPRFWEEFSRLGGSYEQYLR